jgi:hypothetical protein
MPSSTAPVRIAMLRCLRWCLLPVLAAVLAGCPAKDEKGLDFTKSQRQALDKAKGLEATLLDAAKQRGEGVPPP